MKPWKMTYLRRLGLGLFTSLLLTQLKLIEGGFQGIVILLLIPILIYVADNSRLLGRTEK